MKLVVTALLASLVVLAASEPFSWTFLDPASPEQPRSRWRAGAAFGSGAVFVFGGKGTLRNANDTGVQGDTWMFDPTLRIWTQLTLTTSPAPRYGFVGGTVGNYWIISHGFNDTSYYSDTWILDLSNPTEWVELTTGGAGPPDARYLAVGGAYPGGNELWLSMGVNEAGRRLSDTWVLAFNTTNVTGSWRLVSSGGGLNQYDPFSPHARAQHAGAPIAGDTFTVYGGCSSGGQVGGPCPLEDAWRLQDQKWVELPVCPAPRNGAQMIGLPNAPDQAVLWGGNGGGGPGVFPQELRPSSYNESEIFLLVNASSWQRLVTEGDVMAGFPLPREGASLVADTVTGFVYVFGGRRLENESFLSDMWQLRGDGNGSVIVDCPPRAFSFLHLHGVLMYAAWGLLLPLGALLGRYYRKAWPCWFILHIICQSGGLLLTVTGFVVVFLVGTYSEPNYPHAIIGIVLTAILIQQFLSGIFHPCVEREDGETPPEDKSRLRRCWEVYHAVSGFLAIAIGLGQVTLGVFLIVAPLVVWAVWCGLGALWVGVFLVHELVYLCLKVAHRRDQVS